MKESNLSLLHDRVVNYVDRKPKKSSESIGMFFNTISDTMYFFDSGTGKVFTGEKKYLEFLNRFINEKNLEKVLEECKLSEEELKEFEQYIIEEDLLKGLTGEALYSKSSLETDLEEISKGCQQIVLEVTGACNLRCKYCIFGSKKKRIRDFNTKIMSETTILKSLNYMKDHGENTVYITFYGGEPLLAFDKIKFAIEKSLELMPEKEIYFSFTTNLTLLTKEIVEYLSKLKNMSLLCSLDGPKDIHDLYRVDMHGDGTHDKIIKNLELLKKAQKENKKFSVNFNCVYMPPYSIEKLEKIDLYFENLLKDFDGSNNSITYPTEETIPEDIAKQYELSDRSLIQWIEKKVMSEENLDNFKCKGIIDYIMPVHERVITQIASPVLPMNGCCTPGARRLYVNTDGEYYVCERINKSPAIGNIDTGINIDIITEKYYKDYSDKSIEHCANCWAAKMCPVCYADRMNEEGISEKAHDNCESMRNNIRNQFSLYYSVLEKNPEKLSVLNNSITV